MTPCPRPRNKGRRTLKAPRRTTAAALALLGLLALFCGAAQAQAPQTSDPAAAEPERALTPGPQRHILIKTLSQAATPEEAEEKALRTARLLAEKRLAVLGGGAALDPSPEGMRVINAHRFPVLGLSPARAVVLVELRLRGLAEPPPASAGLPSLTVTRDTGELVITATRSCEVILALDPGKNVEPEILPGGGGAAFRLAPGKPLRRPLPTASVRGAARLRVLACTGGLNPPVNAADTDEALSKARIGRPHPVTLQGVVSECVEVQVGTVAGAARSPQMPEGSGK